MAFEHDGLPQLPDSWPTLPADLQRPAWTIRDTMRVTGLSRATIDRLRDDPASGFPRGRTSHTTGRRRSNGPNKGRVLLPAIAVLRWLEGTDR
jgi:hypothetical protein